MDALRQQLGDRSRLEDDQGLSWMRYCWRKSKFGFYNGFDFGDGEVREPSSVLQGFRDHLALIVKPSLSKSLFERLPTPSERGVKGILWGKTMKLYKSLHSSIHSTICIAYSLLIHWALLLIVLCVIRPLV
jgi:hypothetical protein